MPNSIVFLETSTSFGNPLENPAVVRISYSACAMVAIFSLLLDAALRSVDEESSLKRGVSS